MDQLMCCIRYNKENHLVIGCSNLTYRQWDGSLFYVDNVEQLLSEPQFDKNFTKYSQHSIPTGVSDLCWTNKNNFVAGTDQGDIIVLNYNVSKKNYEILMSRKEHDDIINSLDFINRGELVISGSEDTYIKIWDLESQMSLKTYKAHNDSVTSVSSNPSNPECFLSCSQDYSVLSWDQRKEKPALRLSYGTHGFPSCSSWCEINPNIVAIGTENGSLCFYDLRRVSEPIIETQLHQRLVSRIRFKNRLIATCSEDCSTYALKMENESTINKIYNNNEHCDYVKDLSWAPGDSTQYLTCSWDGFIKNHIVQLN